MNKYQGLSESYLSKYAQGNNQLNQIAQNTGAMGAGLMSQYQSGTVPAMEAARRAAMTRPNYVDPAGVTAQMSSDAAQAGLSRNLSRMGVNPNSGKYQGLMQQGAMEGAALKAGAKTNAARAESEDSLKNLMAAAGLGQNLPGLVLSANAQSAAQSQANAENQFKSAEAYGDIAAQQQAAEAKQKNLEETTRKRQMATSLAEAEKNFANLRTNMQLRAPAKRRFSGTGVMRLM